MQLVYLGLVVHNLQGFSMNKAGRIRWTDTRPLLHEEQVSQEDYPRSGVRQTAACTRSLFRPCPGRRVEKPRRLSSKASTEAAVSR